ncbi:hypothetical protein [Streptomyces griseoloalbus]|uniref:hypothetical protein n=1 Tax=Streptomyces griseoloalbus TaxID=67303 RepID=UPI003F690A2C
MATGPVGPRRAVPHRRHAIEAEELSPDCQALMTAAVEAGDDRLGALRAAVVLGGRRWCSAGTLRPPPTSREPGHG